MMRFPCVKFAAIVAALVCGCMRAQAATYGVSPLGDDDAAGTVQVPWLTLQKAANTVNPGDTVIVEDGEYAGFACKRSGTEGKRIVFKAKNKGGAVVNAPDPANDVDLILILSASYITIDGFEVTGARRAGIGIRTLHDDTGADTRDNIVQNCHSHHNGLPRGGAHDGIFTGFALNFTAQNNVVNNNGEHGIYISNSADNPVVRGNESFENVGCGIQLNADRKTGVNGTQDGLISNWLIENNIIHDNGSAGGAGINLDGDINGICRNNLLYNNKASGIALYGIDGAQPSHDNVIVNNTVFQPGSRRAALLLGNGTTNNIVFNNILYGGAGPGIDMDGATNSPHDYNLVSRIAGGEISQHESSPAVNSLFADMAGNDFHLAKTSGAAGAGLPEALGKKAPSTDLENKPRAGKLDIGCYRATP